MGDRKGQRGAGADGAVAEMFARARAALAHAYAPYSSYHVAACVRASNGTLFVGTNVENAAYPQGWCAECSAVASMVAAGEREIAEVLVIGAFHDGKGRYVEAPGSLCTPCGGCRQTISEFAGPETPIHVCGPDGLRRTFTLSELLPASFGPEDLDPG